MKGGKVLLLRWFAAKEEKIPVDTTCGVNHVCGGYVTGGTRRTTDKHDKQQHRDTFWNKSSIKHIEKAIPLVSSLRCPLKN